jgi:hypothetical protein
LTLRWRDARSVVGDDDAHEVVRRIQLRLDDNAARAFHGFDRVVDEVDDDAADLFRIETHEGNAGREPLPDADVGEQAVCKARPCR